MSMTRMMAKAGLTGVLLGASLIGAAPPGSAQTPPQQQLATTATTAATAPAPAAPAPLVIYFASGSTVVPEQYQPVLDHAARLYRAGNPVVMIVSGATDSVGSPALNLMLSQRRADAVIQGLVTRGIPEVRFQALAKGQTEPAVAAPDGTPEAQDRRVEITWR